MPVSVFSSGPISDVAHEWSATSTSVPPPVVEVTRPWMGSSQKAGLVGFEQLEAKLGRKLELRRVFSPTYVENPTGLWEADYAAGRVVVYSMKSKPGILDLPVDQRPAQYAAHKAAIRWWQTQAPAGQRRFVILCVEHEPENSMSPETFLALHTAYYNGLRGGEDALEDVWVIPIYMAATKDGTVRAPWRADLPTIPMDALGVDGYNKVNKRAFNNIFGWWGQQADARKVPWIVCEVSTHGTKEERSTWVAGMDTYATKTDAVSQALKGVIWYDSDGGQDAGPSGWWLDKALAPGWTDVGGIATGTPVEDTLSPPRFRLMMDSHPRRALGPQGEAPPPLPEPPDYGPLPEGTTNYPIPEGAIFAAPNGLVGAAGTEAAPVTAQRALDIVPPGGTVVLRGGDYPVANLQTRWNCPVTIQAYPFETPTLWGSDVVTGWNLVTDGGVNRWRRINTDLPFSTDVSFAPEIINAGRTEAAFPWQVWVDGAPLQQVKTLAEVDNSPTYDTDAPGTFFYDRAAKTMWIGTTPFGKEVRLGVRQVALTGQQDPGLSRVDVKGIAFRHYVNSPNQYAAVRLYGRNAEIENCTFEGCSGAGLLAHSTSGVKVVHNRFYQCGQMGFRAYRLANLEFGYNEVEKNNRKWFETGQAAGGIKIDTECTGAVIHHNYTSKNVGHQLWVDIDSNGAFIFANECRDSLVGRAIMFEISNGAWIMGNYIRGGPIGIGAPGSGEVDVWNNTLVDLTHPIQYLRDSRRSYTRFTARNNLISQRISDSTQIVTTWEDQHGGTFDYLEYEWTTDFSAVYRRAPGTGDFARVTMPGNTRQDFATRAALFAGTDQEEHGLATDNIPIDPYLADDLKTPKAPCVGTGTPAPSPVWYLLGWDAEKIAAPNIGAF